MKIAPIVTQPDRKEKKKDLCLCKTFAPLFCVSRFMGLLPIQWSHKNNKCAYEKSFFWMFYTFVLTCFHIVYVATEIDYRNLFNNRCLILLLDDLTNAVYGYYVICLTLVSFYNFPTWIKTLTKLSETMRDGIFCQSAMKTAIRVQYGYIIMYIATMLVFIGLFCFIIFCGTYKAFSYSETIYRISQSLILIFYSQFACLIAVLAGILACFEKFTMNLLQCRPIHPMKNIDESNNTNDFLGVIAYKQCKGLHPPLARYANLSLAETIEYLRIFHEDLCCCIYSFNDCLNPQLLLSSIVELTVLIIHWYAVVAYLVYTFQNPLSRSVHLLNVFSVVVHSCGLFVFLKNAQHLKNMVQGLVTVLLECSTRLVRLEEHQQIRMFIEKLKQHRPLTASGVFTVDLGIAGPISANILTYVLVALQFEIPKE